MNGHEGFKKSKTVVKNDWKEVLEVAKRAHGLQKPLGGIGQSYFLASGLQPGPYDAPPPLELHFIMLDTCGGQHSYNRDRSARFISPEWFVTLEENPEPARKRQKTHRQLLDKKRTDMWGNALKDVTDPPGVAGPLRSSESRLGKKSQQKQQVSKASNFSLHRNRL